MPDACEVSFDAVSTIRGELFFFKAGFVWRLRGGRLQPGYPALASRHWQGLPSPVDAAFEDAQGHIWFFQGGWGLGNHTQEVLGARNIMAKGRDSQTDMTGRGRCPEGAGPRKRVAYFSGHTWEAWEEVTHQMGAEQHTGAVRPQSLPVGLLGLLPLASRRGQVKWLA